MTEDSYEPDLRYVDLLMDAQAQHEAHPGTFWVPSFDDLANLVPGDRVKIFVEGPEGFISEHLPAQLGGGERFWTTIQELYDDEMILATVDNELLFEEVHGLFYGAPVCFFPWNVLDIIKGAVPTLN